MSEIKLNTKKWCDFVFRGKNKEYGAYALRQGSSDRHIIAIIAALIIAILAGVIPVAARYYSEYQQERKAALMANIDETREMAEVELETPEEEIQMPEDNTPPPPPPPPLQSTVRFVPPVIAPDDEVSKDKEVHTQDELTKSTEVISIEDIVGEDLPDAIDIRDIPEPIVVEPEPEVFTFVEQMPSFPGGVKAMNQFIADNLVYPVVAQEQGIQGRVVIRFVVGTDGNIGNVEVQRGFDKNCDNEAVKVVKKMPRWTPGKQNGKNVPVYFTLPIVFRLKQ